MEWVKLSTSYDTDAAIMRAGEAAEVLFTRSLAYCGREETGGFIPDGMPARLCPKGAAARVKSLVSERLWVRDDEQHGWRIRSWESWQSELDLLAERRRADRERKRREREKRAQSAREARQMSRDTSRDSHVTNGVTSRGLSEGCPDFSPARDREQREETKKETSTQGPYSSQGRTARDVEPPPSDGPPTIVEQILTEYREESPRGVSSKVAAKLAEEIHGLLRDKFTPDEIREGLGQLRVRKLGAGALPSLVDEIANRSNVVALPAGRTNGRATLPPSSAPTVIPPDERCPDHRGERKGKCRHCRAIKIGRPQEIS